VQDCRGCDLYKRATQAVFGEGLRKSKVLMVGEQPGDQEDVQGRPFVGPAGGMLDRGLEEAGIDRKLVYVTNAVKHFKWEARGKRRIHSKPIARELNACRPWLEAELAVIRPALLVALGATAAQSLFGRQFRVTQARGKVFESEWASQCMATVHPSSILRAPDDASRREAYAEFVKDLKVAAKVVAGL
jgi:DNA polymerase